MSASTGDRPGCAPQAAVLGVGLLLGPWAVILLAVTAWDFDYIVQTARSLQLLLLGFVGAGLAVLIAFSAVGIVGLYTRWASPKARKASTKIAIARAQHIELPEGLHSFSMPQPPREREDRRLIEPMPIIEQAPPAALPPPALPQARPGRPLLQQLDEAGLINRSGHQLLVGEGDHGKPVYIDSRKAGVVAVGGAPGSGKSSTVMNLLSQAALMGWGIVVCDPFPEKVDGVMKRSQHLGKAVVKRASSAGEIDQAIRWVDAIGRRRLNGEPWRTPLVLVIEEFSNVILRPDLRPPQETVDLLPMMGMAYRSAGIIIILIGHIWKASLLGGAQQGALLRQIATYTIVHRLAPDAAELLLPIGSEVNPATLPDGVALLTGPDGIYRTSVPWISLEDLAYAGAAQQAQAPTWAPPAQAWTPPPPPPPAEPAPPPAAPARSTVPPTVQLDANLDERILDVLAAAQVELDAEQIAERLGANLGTVKNRLGKMRGEQVITSRTVNRRFMYSLLRRPLTA